ncbi:hypothetical protein Hypma_002588 [Hypsizygus marmoreus]|uniref:Uncharacterized protein n=1 Tax=Hypsizygus marmoreus TaxID=39966 RepID=A0A369J4I8_HYPMA|nr:hypothetical protein Hypma_002588 [Hypsizygus marmoreus]
MTLTFAHPPHYAEALLRRQAEPKKVSTSSTTPSEDRNVHDLPTFDSNSLTHPKRPVLYLPPLLSSLPDRFPSEPVPPDHPPLVTETRLPDIDPASLSLHKALHRFKPTQADYVGTHYAQAFNWSQLVLPEDEEREWYCVAFRSKRKAGSDGGALYDADKLAHEEAIRNGGLILYWYGIPDQTTGMNLATCIWQSRKHAVAANSGPHHIKAMRLAVVSYEVYSLERHVLRKEKGRTGVTIEPYNGGEVGW